MKKNELESTQKRLRALLYVSSSSTLRAPGNFAKAEISDDNTTTVVTFHVSNGQIRRNFEDEQWQTIGLDPEQFMLIVQELEKQALQVARLRRESEARIGAMVVVIDRADAS